MAFDCAWPQGRRRKHAAKTDSCQGRAVHCRDSPEVMLRIKYPGLTPDPNWGKLTRHECGVSIVSY
jgi:hypothetical protein